MLPLQGLKNTVTLIFILLYTPAITIINNHITQSLRLRNTSTIPFILSLWWMFMFLVSEFHLLALILGDYHKRTASLSRAFDFQVRRYSFFCLEFSFHRRQWWKKDIQCLPYSFPISHCPQCWMISNTTFCHGPWRRRSCAISRKWWEIIRDHHLGRSGRGLK